MLCGFLFVDKICLLLYNLSERCYYFHILKIQKNFKIKKEICDFFENKEVEEYFLIQKGGKIMQDNDKKKVTEEKEKMIENVKKFTSDYFIHYALRKSEDFRNSLCGFINNTTPAKSTYLIHESVYRRKLSRKRVRDVPFKDENGFLYNVEMENGYIGHAQLSRFQSYLVSMVDDQIDEGKTYKELKPVKQLIISTNSPIKNLNNAFHDMMLADLKGQLILEYGLFDIMFLQTQLMEDISMESELGKRLVKAGLFDTMKLFSSSHLFVESGRDKLSKEMINIYECYIDDEAYLDYVEAERDRMVQEARMDDAIEHAHELALAEGIEKEHIRSLNNLKMNIEMMVENKYHIKDLKWIDQLDEQQLNHMLLLLIQDISYEELQGRI